MAAAPTEPRAGVLIVGLDDGGDDDGGTVGQGWCRWRGLPQAVVIRDVLQGPRASLSFDQGTQMDLNNTDMGVCVCVCVSRRR